MKKNICIALMFVICLVMNAKTTVTITEGDNSIIKQKTTCVFDIDFTEADIEGVSYNEYMASRDDHFRNAWPQEQQEVKEEFIKQWNKTNKNGMQLVLNGETPNKMLLKFRSVDFGNTAMSAIFGGFAGGGANGSGELLIYQNDNIMLAVDFLDVNGPAMYTETKRTKALVKNIIKQVYKKIKK